MNIENIRTGDENEFRKLIDENIDYLYSVAFRIIGNEAEAVDIVQETFIRIWEKRNSIRSGKSLRPLLRQIAVNKCLDQLRRKKRRPDYRTVDSSLIYNITGDDQADLSLRSSEVSSLLAALASNLSPMQRVVFTLIELEEHSHDEAAEITGLSKNAIKSNLSHARRKMEDNVRNYLN